MLLLLFSHVPLTASHWSFYTHHGKIAEIRPLDYNKRTEKRETRSHEMKRKRKISTVAEV